MASIGLKAKNNKLVDDFSDFDFNDFDVEYPDSKNSKSKSPVLKTLGAMKKGAKNYITTSSNIEKFVKAAMPTGYGQAYELAQEGASELRQLYNSAEAELRPVKETSKSLLRKLLPKADGKIPAKLKRKLEAYSKEEQKWQSQGGDGREDQLGSLLSGIFEQKASDQQSAQVENNEREKLRQGFAQVRHRQEMSQLDKIRIATQSLVQYNNNVMYNVQKKQLEIGYRQLWALADLNKEQKASNAAMRQMVKDLVTNTGLPDYAKQSTGGKLKELTRNRFLENTREGMFGGGLDYIRRFSRNVGDQVLGKLKGFSGVADGVGGMADMASDMGDMPGVDMKSEMIAALMNIPLNAASEWGSRKAYGMTTRDSKTRRKGSSLAYGVTTAGDRAQKYLTDPTKSWKGWGLESLRELLASAAPTNTPESRMEADTIDRMHEAAPFKRSNSKSLDEVIPGLLARIHREIKILRTGDESTSLITYDYTKNKFTTEKQLAVDLRQRIAGNHTDNANKYATSILDQVDKGRKLTPEQREIARKSLIDRSVKGESLDVKNIWREDSWGGGENGKAIAGVFNRHLRAEGGELPHNDRSYRRQIDLVQKGRGIVGSAGDPRVLLQQMVNAGQLGSLKEMGILDERNTVNRDVYANWLQGNTDEFNFGAQTPNAAGASQFRKVKKPGDQSGASIRSKVSPNRTFVGGLSGDAAGTLTAIKDRMEQSSVETNVQSISDILGRFEEKYTYATDVNHQTLQMMLGRLTEIAVGGVGSGPGGAPIAKDSKGGVLQSYTSLWEHAKDKGANFAGQARAYAGKLADRAKGMWEKFYPQAAQKAEQAWKLGGKKVSDLRGQLQNAYGDVYVSGESFPRLRASLIKAGAYRDKKTGRVIGSLEDITGDVIDAAGNTIITMEEFYDGYIGGSVNKKVREVFGQAKAKLLDWKSQLEVFIPQTFNNARNRINGAVQAAIKALPPYDVYVKSDMKHPVMYANKMRFEYYFSAKTGNAIRHPRDIDGVVIDGDGNIVVGEEHLESGLVDIDGDAVGRGLGRMMAKGMRKAKNALTMMRDAAIGLFGSISKGLGNASEYFKNFFTPFADMITNSKKTVDLLEKIHSLLDDRMPGGKKVRGDLSGDGIRDGSLEDIRRKRREADGDALGGKSEGDGKAPGGFTGSLMAGLASLFKKKKKQDDEEDDDEDSGWGLSDLADGANIMDSLRGRGDRSAARKRLKRMKGAKAAGKGSRLGRLAKWGMFNTDIVRGIGKGAGAVGRGGLAAAGGLGRMGSAALGGGIGGLARVGGLAAAGYGIAQAGSALADDSLTTGQKTNAVGRAAAGAAGGWAGAKVGGMAGAAVGSVVPVVGTAIGGVLGTIIGGGLGYWGATSLGDKLGGLGTWWNTPSKSALSKLRIVQYGINPDDSGNVQNIFTLEAMLEKNMTLQPSGIMTLDSKEMDMKEVAELFGISQNSDMQLFNMWYRRRFVPVFKSWLTAVRKVKPDGKLKDIEDIIPKKDKVTVAENSVNSNTVAYSHAVGWSRANLKLEMSGQKVIEYFASMKAALLKERQDATGEHQDVENKTTAVSTTKDAAALALKATTDKANYNVTDKDGKAVDPNSMQIGELTEKIKKGDLKVAITIAVPTALVQQGNKTLDALTSIRFKAYGLEYMSADKVRTLYALEKMLAGQMSPDTESATLNMSTDAVMQVAGEVFGVPNPTGAHAERWKYWFNGRFVPVFLTYAGAIRQKTKKSNFDEAQRMTAIADQLALARAIVGAQGISRSGGKVPVWSILDNPWADDFKMNSDPDTTAGNMEAIRQLSDKIQLGQISAKPPSADPNADPLRPSKKDKQAWKDPNEGTVRYGNNSRGIGFNATGDTVTRSPDSKATALGSGTTGKINITGGAGGNYTDLPIPTGSGWGAVKDTIIKAAEMVGVDPMALITTIAQESSFNPNAAPRNPNLPSSAKGLGQHLDSSWLEDLQRDGKRFGIPNGVNQFDARASALMTAARLKYNSEKLAKSIGRAVTTTDAYLAHLMGLGGATKFLTAPQDAIGAEVSPTTAKQHPEYFYDGTRALTVKEVYGRIDAKLAKKPAEFGVDSSDVKSRSAKTQTVGTNSGPSADAGKASTGGGSGPAPTASSGSPPTVTGSGTSARSTAGSARLEGPTSVDSSKAATIGTGPAVVKGSNAKYELILQREDSEEDGTYGTLTLPDGTVLNTLELPWKDNASKASSIPPGIYPCKKRPTKSFGDSYEVNNVPGRSAILIHAGNSAGNTNTGMKADTQGCILLGMGRGRKGGQKVITASKPAMSLFHEKMADMPFTLIVRQGKADAAKPVAGGRGSSISFDPARKGAIDASQEARQGVPGGGGAAMPNTTARTQPTVPVIGSGSSAPEPLMSPRTSTSVTPGAPSAEVRRAQDDASSAALSPKLDSVVSTLLSSLEVQKGSADILSKILQALSNSGAAPEKVSAASAKVEPVTTTSVPVPMRRNL